jgi:FlaA1/EpsC-like NDP-sugar epimerase
MPPQMKKIEPRNIFAFLHDVGAVALAWSLAYLVRFNFDLPPVHREGMISALFWVLPVHGIIAWRVGLYRNLWRYASLNDIKRILIAAGLSAGLVTIIVSLASLQAAIPRTVLLLNPLLLIVLMSGSRIGYRMFKEYRLYGHANLRGEPVIVLGSGDHAVNLLRDLRRSPYWHVVGLLDDDKKKWGRQINDVKVLGGIDDLPLWAKKFGLRNVILALPSATASQRRKAIERAGDAHLSVLTVPSPQDVLSGRIAISEIRCIELEDLLGREAVNLDDAGLHTFLTDHRIMVTGAGGSIGSELCRQIAAFAPQRLIFFEFNEFALYSLEQEFQRCFPDVPIVCAIGNIMDARRLAEVIGQHSPHVIFHAAAYKHVPLMESENAWSALANNVLGTLRVARAADAGGVGKFVMVSTDKAVNPTNVMGASKRLAERVCQVIQKESATRFVAVRFGNVLGSTGSVIPKFREQIARGGPVTVTHPEINRYFMTIPEAAQLVLQAGYMGQAGEIFVMDMGEPVLIRDLARDMIRLSGYSEEEIEIVFTGLRPGEKLYEELLANDETTVPTLHPKLRAATCDEAPGAEWLGPLQAWIEDAPPANEQALKSRLQTFVPEYQPAR